MNKHFIIVFTLCALFNIFTLNAFANTTSEQIYHFASNNDISSLYKNSDSLNALNKDGDTALCVAIKNNDVDAYKTLKKVGANTSPACIKNINKQKYENFISTVKKNENSFAGLNSWVWGAIGLGALGVGTAIVISDNDNDSSSSNDDEQFVTNPTCQERGYSYKYSDHCPDGWIKNNNDYCNNNDGNGLWFKCDVPYICPEEYSIQCADGYDEIPGDICLSGKTVYKHCVPTRCPYVTTSCSGGYHETGNTCLSGNILYKECQKIQCGEHGTWSDQGCICANGWTGTLCDTPVVCPYTTTSCNYGYVATGETCQSGDNVYVQCVFDSDNYIEHDGNIYEKLNCVHGIQIADVCSCTSGWAGNMCDTPARCDYTTTSCTGMYQESGKTCQSGNEVYKECEPIQCGANATWSEEKCICDPGYGNWKRGFGCYDIANCGSHAHSDGENCICEPGYTNWTNTTAFTGCSPRSDSLVINNSTSEENVIGISDTLQFLIYHNAINIHNSTDSDVAAIFIDDLQEKYQSTVEYGGTIYINNTGDGDVYGIKHVNNIGGITSNSSGHENFTFDDGKIIINNTGNGDVYGIYSNTNSDAKPTDVTANLHVNYNERTHSGNSFYSNALINITNHGDGNIYGLWGGNLRNTVVDSVLSSSPDLFRKIYGNINIENDGNGNAYGMYVAYGDSVYYSSNATYGTGNITIKNKELGNSFGIFGGTTPVYNAINGSTQITTTGNINIINESVGNVYGMYGDYLLNAYGNGNNTASQNNTYGRIDIVNEGTGNAYGMYVTKSEQTDNNIGINASGFADSIIKILNKSNGASYGMFGPNLTNATGFSAKANIDLTNYANGTVYGMYGNTISNGYSNIFATSEINLQNYADGKAVGIYTNGGIVENSGEININNIGTGSAIGIFGDINSIINNSGTINITRDNYTDEDGIVHTVSTESADFVFGIYAKSGSAVNNYGIINITSNGNAYGIYAESGATVYNYSLGTIVLNGQSCSGDTCSGAETYGNHIVLNGSTLYNSGVIRADVLNLNSMGGKVVAGAGSQFIVKNALVGDLNISSDIVTKGNQTTYIAKNMIDAKDVSELNIHSASAMFNASLADNGHDVIMQMRDFNELTDNKSLASFLKNNYDKGNVVELFNALKSMDNITAFNGALLELTGLNTFTRFAHEDLSAMREISFSMNNKLFDNSDREKFDIFDSLGYFSFSNNHNGGFGQYGISSEKISENWKLGYGIAMANINTGDGDSMHRQNKMWLFYVPAIYTKNNYELTIAPKAGFTYGDYSRRGYNNINYDGYIEKRVFGLMNDLRYPIQFGNLILAPDLALNTIVYEQRGYEDGREFSLIIPDDRTISIEMGLGFYTKYEKKISDGGHLKLSSGVMLYREFGDAYNIKLGIRGMDGMFSLYNNDYKYRGAASFGFDYAYNRLHVYGDAQYFMDNDKYINFKGGIRFIF